MKITHDSYSFVEKDVDDDQWYVQLKEGDYSGVVYKYGKIQVKERDYDQAQLQFQYAIIECPDHLDRSELQTDEVFMNTLGDVLTHIIEDSFTSNKFKLGENDKPTDS